MDSTGQICDKLENPTRIGFTSILVLPFLNGQPWDDLARAYVHALRPSRVRVSESWITCDAMLWRVTVMLKNGVVAYIEQEVEVDLSSGEWQNGHELRCALLDRGEDV